MKDVRRRQITEADIESAATLLHRGFPHRSRDEWLAGLQRQRTRHVPEGHPRFGLLLEHRGDLVGIVLTIFSEIEDGGRRSVRCHLSSWYVDAAFKAYSPFLVSHLLKDRTHTFVNISAASHTRGIIEAQGFKAYSNGWLLTLPWIHGSGERVRVRRFEGVAAESDGALIERRLLEEHSSFGCLCLLVQAADGNHPFVFTRRRRLGRFVTTCTLVYCRNLADYVRFAGPLGRALLRHGIPTVIVDNDDGQHRIAGRRISMEQPKYFRGPVAPRAGDNAFSELAIFGR